MYIIKLNKTTLLNSVEKVLTTTTDTEKAKQYDTVRTAEIDLLIAKSYVKYKKAIIKYVPENVNLDSYYLPRNHSYTEATRSQKKLKKSIAAEKEIEKTGEFVNVGDKKRSQIFVKYGENESEKIEAYKLKHK